MDMRIGLYMDRNHPGTGFYKLLGVTPWLNNHQMRVNRQLGCMRDCFHHRQADCNVGHEAPVHHVNVKQGSASALDELDLFAEAAKVCGQYRWGNLNH